jgi:predicted SAM-dependent methyltransferase
VRVIIGAGDQRYDGWIPTDQHQLDLADASSF